MTATIARLILAMLILPATGAVFVLAFLAMLRPGAPPSTPQLLFLWTVVYLFVGTYWLLLWHGVVRWTRRRVVQTVGGAVAALAGAVVVAGAGPPPPPQAPPPRPLLLGGAAGPLVGGLLARLAWREAPGGATWGR